MSDTVERRATPRQQRAAALDRSIDRALWRIAQPRLQRIADEVPRVSVEKFAADHGVALPDWVDAETRAVYVRFDAVWKHLGYAGQWEKVGRDLYSPRKHIKLSVRLRVASREERVAVFLHELAHIVAGRRGEHGPRWRAVARALGVANPRARGDGGLTIALGPADTSAYDRENLTDETLGSGTRQGELFAEGAV